MTDNKICLGLHWMDRTEALEWLRLKAPELLERPPSIFVPVKVTGSSHVLISHVLMEVTAGALLHTIAHDESDLPGISCDFSSQRMWFVSFESRAEHDERVLRADTCPGCCGDVPAGETTPPSKEC